jgi:hypothetical protein
MRLISRRKNERLPVHFFTKPIQLVIAEDDQQGARTALRLGRLFEPFILREHRAFCFVVHFGFPLK